MFCDENGPVLRQPEHFAFGPALSRCRRKTQTAASLPSLIAALSDGPLQVRPAVHLRGAVTAQAAANAANKAVGINFQAAQA